MFITHSTFYNYADDNTLSYASNSKSDLVNILEKESLILIDWFSINQMKANPEKFQAIALGKKTHDLNLTFNLDSIEIPCDDEVKLLGVTFDFMLNFNIHITNMCKKASRQLNAMKRIGRFLSKLGRLTMYHSFIMSNFNYCPMVWSFTGETNLKKIEKIQERSLRFIYEDYASTYDQLLLRSALPTLKVRRMRTLAIETFRILNKHGPIYLHDLLKFKNTDYNFRYNNLVDIPRPHTHRYGKSTFKYAASSLWNSLPDHFRTMTSFNQFKNSIQKWNGNQCKCSSCGQI